MPPSNSGTRPTRIESDTVTETLDDPVQESPSAPSTRDGIASQRIANSLRDAILSGAYSPGSRLRQEDIAEQFDASRLPVREALRTLQADGLVTIVANTGAWISRLSMAECREMYQIRERIEPLLLTYSQPFLSSADLAQLESLVHEMEIAADTETFLRLDREFHMLTYSGADTLILGPTVERLWNSTQHYRRAFTKMLDPRGNSVIHLEHNLLVAALQRGDVEEAERVLFGHIRRTRLELVRHPDLFA
jgi:DNA-binding GntR family transcriptional regulator